MGKIGKMDNQGFRAMFNFKVDDAKSKYRTPVEEDSAEKLKKLKAKIISDVKEEFLKAIPKVINPFEECIISSNWIEITGAGIESYIEDVGFSAAGLECFFTEISMDLRAILNRPVQVDIDKASIYPQLRRFSVKV